MSLIHCTIKVARSAGVIVAVAEIGSGVSGYGAGLCMHGLDVVRVGIHV